MKKLMFILLLFVIISCTKIEYVDRIVYKDNLIYPEIPKLEQLSDFNLKELELELYEIDNQSFYCLNDNDTIQLIKNISTYKEIVSYYENLIYEYNIFYKNYYEKKNNHK